MNPILHIYTSFIYIMNNFFNLLTQILFYFLNITNSGVGNVEKEPFINKT